MFLRKPCRCSQKKAVQRWRTAGVNRRGCPRLDVAELARRAWCFVREGFREYQKKRHDHGLKRHQARKDAERSRKEIEQLVRRQLNQEIRQGKFHGGLHAALTEIERRVKERTVLSRGHTTRLDDLRLTLDCSVIQPTLIVVFCFPPTVQRPLPCILFPPNSVFRTRPEASARLQNAHHCVLSQ